MSRAYITIAASLSAVVAVAAASASQQPRITNGAVTAQPAGAPFAQWFRTLVESKADVTWIGYAVPVVDGEHDVLLQFRLQIRQWVGRHGGRIGVLRGLSPGAVLRGYVNDDAPGRGGERRQA
jgi:hypothetical protein